VPFSGGFLELKHNGDRTFINWGQALSRGSWCPTTMRSVPIPDAALHWVAFFGDVMHAVDKVHSGMRLTLTYVLHRQPPADPTADALLVRASVLHGKLLAALGDKAFMKEGGSLGFHCRWGAVAGVLQSSSLQLRPSCLQQYQQRNVLSARACPYMATSTACLLAGLLAVHLHTCVATRCGGCRPSANTLPLSFPLTPAR
jgi:hypothetical protein